MRSGNTIIAIVVGSLAVLFFILALTFFIVFGRLPNLFQSIGGALFGNATATSSENINLEQIDCSGAKAPKIYLPAIKQAAKRFLSGDEAALLAVIQIESTYVPDAISNTGAVGLGQFVAPTARGIQSAGLFRGQTIVTVPRADKVNKRVTEAEKIAFRQIYFSEGRLQPGYSIEATAYYLKNALKRYGSLHDAYAEGYNGSTTIQANGRMEKDNAADRVVEIYNKIKADGGCKELEKPAGQLGAELRSTVTNH